MQATERPQSSQVNAAAEPKTSARSHASTHGAAAEEVSALQQLLNKCEVELEAKNHMVQARDTQIEEFKQTIEQLKKQVAEMNDQVSIDTTAQREEMRSELEALKQKVLDELKQKS